VVFSSFSVYPAKEEAAISRKRSQDDRAALSRPAITFALQAVHVSNDHLLPFSVLLHKDNPVEAVLMFGGENLRVIDAFEVLHLAVRDSNRLLTVF
jgi:hypothetical protein